MTAVTSAGVRRMPLAAHLREASKRLKVAAAALVVAVVVAYGFSESVLDILRAPLATIAANRNAGINYDSVTGAFDLKVKIAVFGGIVLSSPVWLYQLFAFITPGLNRRERRYVFGFMGAAVPLFLGGCATAFMLLPRMVELLLGFAGSEDSSLLQASNYFDFVLKLVLAAGIAFTLPVFLVVFNLMGLLPAEKIARSWRWSLIAIVIFSALLTPAADLMSMFLIAVPMFGLFVLSWFIAYLHDRRQRRRAAADAIEGSALTCWD